MDYLRSYGIGLFCCLYFIQLSRCLLWSHLFLGMKVVRNQVRYIGNFTYQQPLLFIISIYLCRLGCLYFYCISHHQYSRIAMSSQFATFTAFMFSPFGRTDQEIIFSMVVLEPTGSIIIRKINTRTIIWLNFVYNSPL